MDPASSSSSVPSSPAPSSPTHPEVPSPAEASQDDVSKEDMHVPLLRPEFESESHAPDFVKKHSISAFAMAVPSWLTFSANATLNLLCIALVGVYSSELDLAAMGLSNVFCNITGFSIIWGLIAAIHTLSAQALGAKEYTMIGTYLQRSIILVTVLGVIPIAVTWAFAEPILLGLGQNADVVEGVQTFSYYRIPGLVTQGIFVPLSATLTSIGKTAVSGQASCLAAILGCGLAYLFIVRLSLGLEGAAIVQTTREFIQTVYLLVAAYFNPEFRRCWTPWSRRALQGWIPFLKISLPSMVMQNVEWWSWEIVTFESGLLSAELLATQTVLANVTNMTYFVPLSLSYSVTMLVGKFLGARDVAAAKKVGLVLVLETMLVLLAGIVGIVLARRPLANLFSSDSGVTAAVVQMAPLCVSFSFFDGLQCSLTGVVKGAGQQKIFAPIIVVCYWVIGIPLGYVLAFQLDYKLLGLWYGMVAAVSLHCLAYSLTLLWISFDRAAEEAVARIQAEKRSAATDQSMVSVTAETTDKPETTS